jgi:hypothetical protein
MDARPATAADAGRLIDFALTGMEPKEPAT